MFEYHSRIISTLNAMDRELKEMLPEETRLLFIDEDYVNYIYFNELLSNSGAEIINAVSIPQAIYKLKFEKGIKIIFISAGFAENYNFPIIRYLKDKFLLIPIVTILDEQSNDLQQKCFDEGSDYCFNRHLDSNHLTKSIRDILASLLYTKYLINK